MSSLFGTMFEAVTGTGDYAKKSKKHSSSNREYHNNSHRNDFEVIQDKMRQAAFKNKQAYEKAQTRAWIRGWKK